MAVSQRPVWTSRFNFIVASAGSAIGLGNIWKFPYTAGQNGGGIFVIAYLVCVLIIGTPLLFAEMYIGQRSQTNALSAFKGKKSRRSIWMLGGLTATFAAFLMLTYYFVVGGWILNFLFISLHDAFLLGKVSSGGHLNRLMSDHWGQIFWHTLFTGFVLTASFSGFRRGIEQINRYLMPGLFLLLIGLIFYVSQLPGFSKATQFLFDFRDQTLDSKILLEALGNAFFTLSIGIGVMITYGGFLRDSRQLSTFAVTISALDTAVAIGASVVIFTVAFSFGQNIGEGPGLIFITLPQLFAKMPSGEWVAVFFFLLVLFAAFSSAISAFLVNVQVLRDEKNWSVRKSTFVVGAGIYLVGLLCDLSPNLLSGVQIYGHSIFNAIDQLVSNFLLPTSGFFVSTYFGWVLIPKFKKRRDKVDYWQDVSLSIDIVDYAGCGASLRGDGYGTDVDNNHLNLICCAA